MDEIAPGLLHWTTFHEGIGQDVSSYYVEPAATLIDPCEPAEGLDALRGRHRAPELVVLTIRHHYRHSDRFAEALGCRVVCHEAGMHELEGDDRAVEPFAAGDELADGIRALAFGAIAPDDAALAIDVGGGALAFGDGLIESGGEPGFVPDRLIGDDPEAVKAASLERLRRMLGEHRFEHLLFAHGGPIVGDGRTRLERFVAEADAGGRAG